MFSTHKFLTKLNQSTLPKTVLRIQACKKIVPGMYAYTRMSKGIHTCVCLFPDPDSNLVSFFVFFFTARGYSRSSSTAVFSSLFLPTFVQDALTAAAAAPDSRQLGGGGGGGGGQITKEAEASTLVVRTFGETKMADRDETAVATRDQVRESARKCDVLLQPPSSEAGSRDVAGGMVRRGPSGEHCLSSRHSVSAQVNILHGRTGGGVHFTRELVLKWVSLLLRWRARHVFSSHRALYLLSPSHLLQITLKLGVYKNKLDTNKMVEQLLSLATNQA